MDKRPDDVAGEATPLPITEPDTTASAPIDGAQASPSARKGNGAPPPPSQGTPRSRRPQKKMTKKARLISNVSLVLFALVFVFSAYNLFSQMGEYSAGTKEYDGLEDYAPLVPVGTGDGDTPLLLPNVDFDKLRAINADVCGWIYGPNTQLNYPIVLSKDNEYYLSHTYTGKSNAAGSIFMDMKSKPDFTDPNTILHGHRMKNNSMFGSVADYVTRGYYAAHPVIYLITPEKTYEMVVFSMYNTEASGDYVQRTFNKAGDFDKWIARVIKRSAVDTGITPVEGDRIVTLSTCGRGDTKTERVAIHCVLREFVPNSTSGVSPTPAP